MFVCCEQEESQEKESPQSEIRCRTCTNPFCVDCDNHEMRPLAPDPSAYTQGATPCKTVEPFNEQPSARRKQTSEQRIEKRDDRSNCKSESYDLSASSNNRRKNNYTTSYKIPGTDQYLLEGAEKDTSWAMQADPASKAKGNGMPRLLNSELRNIFENPGGPDGKLSTATNQNLDVPRRMAYSVDDLSAAEVSQEKRGRKYPVIPLPKLPAHARCTHEEKFNQDPPLKSPDVPRQTIDQVVRSPTLDRHQGDEDTDVSFTFANPKAPPAKKNQLQESSLVSTFVGKTPAPQEVIGPAEEGYRTLPSPKKVPRNKLANAGSGDRLYDNIP